MRQLFASNGQEIQDLDPWNKGNTRGEPMLDVAFCQGAQEWNPSRAQQSERELEMGSGRLKQLENAGQGTKKEGAVRGWRGA